MREGLRGTPRLAREVVECFAQRDLLTYASAVAFQVLLAVIPMALTAAAVLGVLGLDEVWQDELRPEVSAALPQDTFEVVDRTVRDTLGDKRVLWLTFGVVFTVWQLSGAVRATSGPLNLVYEVEEHRPWGRRVLASILVSVAILPLLVIAVVAMAFGDNLIDTLGPDGPLHGVALAVRWLLTACALLTVVWVVLHFIPAHRAHARWIGVGTGLVVGGWLAASGLYAIYLTQIADYSTIFGNLAGAFVLLSYLYILAVVFIGGCQVDALLRHRLADGPPGDPGTPPEGYEAERFEHGERPVSLSR